MTAVTDTAVFLGIDPGTRFCGYAVMRKSAGQLALLDCGCLMLGTHRPLAQRLVLFRDNCQNLIQKYGVTHLAIETPFLGKNAQNFLKLGYLRGILLMLAHEKNIIVTEFSPRQVKQALTGTGAASKEQVANVVHRLMPHLPPHLRTDTTDALAITLCGAWKINIMRPIQAEKSLRAHSATI